LLRGAGFGFEGASLLAAVLQIGGLVGGLVLAVQMDRNRTIGALLAGYAVVALGLIALALVAPAVAAWGLLLLLIGMGVGGAHMAMPAVAAGIYPTTMLSAGIGLAVTIARFGAMVGPMAGAALIGAQVTAGTFFLALLAPVAGCVLCVLAFARVRNTQRPSAPAG
jgi:AAHS family 4-hydroxybenzoate transporter-like MFS transporter